MLVGCSKLRKTICVNVKDSGLSNLINYLNLTTICFPIVLTI